MTIWPDVAPQRDPLQAINDAAMRRATLADEIARAAVDDARWGLRPAFDAVADWRWRHQREWGEVVAYARACIRRTPSPNSPATGGRIAQEGGLAPGEGNPPGLTMPPLW